MKAIKLMLALMVVLLVVTIAINARDNGAVVDTGATEQDTEAENEMIRVSSLEAGDVVSSPLTVTGEARGTWYFEASFPVKLLDQSGNTIATAVATAQGDWMTTDFVPFTATLTFPAQPSGSTGTLVLEKDNPSGLPQNADSLSITIQF